jgi:hypothetical protein
MFIYLALAIISIFLLVYLKKMNVESFYQGYNFITMEEFNERFDSEIITLTKDMMAVGINNNEWYIYYFNPGEINDANSLSNINYFKNHIHPNINKNKYYFIFYRNDGLREGLLYHEDLILIVPKEKEYDNLFLRDTDSKTYPLLHKKKYIFTYSGYINDPTAILIPDRYFVDRNGHKDVLKEIDNNRIEFINKKNLLTWRGTLDLGYKTNFFNPENKNDLNQRNYFKYLYDIQLLKNVEYGDNRLSIPEMMNYKYILDIDGWSNTWDATVWKLYSGSVLLKVKSVFKQWYYEDLKEWIHYVPVENDLSDLNEKIYWCIHNNEKCIEITNNAKQFVIEKLNWHIVKQYTIDTFIKYLNE